jgi:hypothetical protein
MKAGREKLASLIEALGSETSEASKEEDYVVETELLRVPDGNALDDINKHRQ